MPVHSPEIMRGSQVAFCSSEPWWWIEGQGVPAAVDELLVDRREARRGADDPVFQPGADLVALAIQRGEAVAGQLGRLLQHRVDGVVRGMLVAGQAGHLLQAGNFAQRETHVGERGGISHFRSSGPQYAALGRFWRRGRVFSAP